MMSYTSRAPGGSRHRSGGGKVVAPCGTPVVDDLWIVYGLSMDYHGISMKSEGMFAEYDGIFMEYVWNIHGRLYW